MLRSGTGRREPATRAHGDGGETSRRVYACVRPVRAPGREKRRRGLILRAVRWHNATVARLLTRRLLTSALLLAWLATPVASAGLLLHVTSHHGHDEHLALDLAVAASHGHSHRLSVVEHEHSAIRESAPPVLPDLAEPTTSRVELAAIDPVTRAELSDPSPPTGSPPLFYRYCALLL